MSLILIHFSMAAIVVGIFLLGWIMPSATRTEIVFGIRFSEPFSLGPEIAALRARYRRNYLLSQGPLTLALVAMIFSGPFYVLLNVGIVAQIVVLMLNYLALRRRTAEAGSRARRRPEDRRPGPHRRRAAPGAVFMVMVHRPRHPCAGRFSGSGLHVPETSGHDRRSLRPVRSRRPLGAEVSVKRFAAALHHAVPARRHVVRILGFPGRAAETESAASRALGVAGRRLPPPLGLLVLPGTSAAALSVATSLGMLAYAIVLAWTTGQAGSRLKVGPDDAAGRNVAPDDDACWKWGLFYYNPDDPAMFVEKRFGVGYTVNFANPRGVLALVGILALGAGLAAFAVIAGK